MVLLDHLTRGRVMIGAGPGALPSDAFMMGIDPANQRDMMEEALEAILLLLAGETVTMETDWFTLTKARLQLRPYQRPFPEVAVAAQVSPAGPRAAGRFGCSLLSIGATSAGGFDVLGAHWDVMEERAAEFGTTVDRNAWRLVGPMHIADTKEQAVADVAFGLGEWVDYFQRVAALPLAPNTENFESLVDALNASGFAVIGTVDDAIAQVERLQAQSGGFGTLLAHGPRVGRHRGDPPFLRAHCPLRGAPLPGHRRTSLTVEPGLGGREPARVHRRGGQRRHVGHPEAPRGEGRKGRAARRRRHVADIAHEQIPANGIELHVAVAGPADGRPIVLCHGFPELWYSWRHQLGALGDAGYRALAPDLRGYGGSSHPRDVAAYGSDQLTGDLCGLLDHYGYETRRLLRPRLGLHGGVGAGPAAPRTRRGHLQHERPLFAGVGAADGDLPAHLRRRVLLHALLPRRRPGRGGVRRRPAPLRAHHALFSQRRGHGQPQPARVERAGGRAPGFLDILTPPPDVLPAWLTEHDVDVYTEGLRQGGLFGPVSFYRNLDANWERSKDLPASRYTMPTGFITGSLDPVNIMMPGAVEAMAELLPDFRGATVVDGRRALGATGAPCGDERGAAVVPGLSV